MSTEEKFWRVRVAGARKAHLTAPALLGSGEVALCGRRLDERPGKSEAIYLTKYQPTRDDCKACLTMAGFFVAKKERVQTDLQKRLKAHLEFSRMIMKSGLPDEQKFALIQYMAEYLRTGKFPQR
jgi:hypothetical protein